MRSGGTASDAIGRTVGDGNGALPDMGGIEGTSSSSRSVVIMGMLGAAADDSDDKAGILIPMVEDASSTDCDCGGEECTKTSHVPVDRSESAALDVTTGMTETPAGCGDILPDLRCRMEIPESSPDTPLSSVGIPPDIPPDSGGLEIPESAPGVSLSSVEIPPGSVEISAVRAEGSSGESRPPCVAEP